MKTILKTFALALAALASLPAVHAQAPDKVVISLADLDMTAPGRGETLLQRIRSQPATRASRLTAPSGQPSSAAPATWSPAL